MSKIFCIGLHKTGTSSCQAAVEHFGYRGFETKAIQEPDLANTAWQRLMHWAGQYDFLRGSLCVGLWKRLAEEYPTAKFILTYRDVDSWWKSVLSSFGHEKTKMREWLYGEGLGAPEGNEEAYKERFNLHYSDVYNFAQGKDNFLFLNISGGQGWDMLAPFLGHEVPNVPFPLLGAGIDTLNAISQANKPSQPSQVEPEKQQEEVPAASEEIPPEPEVTEEDGDEDDSSGSSSVGDS